MECVKYVKMFAKLKDFATHTHTHTHMYASIS